MSGFPKPHQFPFGNRQCGATTRPLAQVTVSYPPLSTKRQDFEDVIWLTVEEPLSMQRVRVKFSASAFDLIQRITVQCI